MEVLRIEWPSGTMQELRDVAVNQILTVTEPVRLTPTAPGRFAVQSWKGQSFQVQCSTNLNNWMAVVTITKRTGTIEFNDVTAPQHAACFYRLQQQ